MKKIFCVLAFLPSLFQAQDLSWGVGANFGLAGVTNDIDIYSVNKNQFYSIRPYLNYRIYKNLRVQFELPIQILNSEYTRESFEQTRYNYYNDYWDYFYGYCNILSSYSNKNVYFSPTLLAELRLKNFSISVGGAINAIQLGGRFELNSQSVQHNITYPYESSYTDAAIISNSFIYHYRPSLSFFSPVFGLSYHMKSLEVGYRYAIGKHQLTVGYDIGRYRYE